MTQPRIISREILNWVFIANIIIVGPLLAYSLPDTMASNWFWFQAFVEFMAGHVPSINQIVVVSAFPDVTRMFLAIEWGVIAPIFIMLFVKYYGVTPLGIAMIRPKFRWWHVWIFPLFVIGMVYVCIDLPLKGPPPYIEKDRIVVIIQLMSESRYWLGVFGSALVFFATFFFVVFFRLPAIYRGINSKQNDSAALFGLDKQ